SIYNISSKGESKFQNQLSKDNLIELMENAIGVKPKLMTPTKMLRTVNEISKSEDQEELVKIETFQVESPKMVEIEEEKEIKIEPPSVTVKPQKVAKKPVKKQKLELPIITTEKILSTLTNEDWQPITHLIFKLKIQDMMDARFLQLKMKELLRKGLVEEKIIKTKKHWKLK
ncbi:MAG: hypothetical protein ACFE8V_01730, partial [Promethearchaeota archaeon]